VVPLSAEACRSIQLRWIEPLSSRRRSALTISLFETRALDGMTERVLCGSFVIQETNANDRPPSEARATKARSW
jgi:hypothetical protein